ncbi:hypothetical protein Tco_1280151 [Tanacetum coccineum]
MRHDALARCRIHSEDIIDWDFLANQGLAQAFFESINKDPFFCPQWVNLFQTNKNVYQELAHEFFASFEFDTSPCRYDPNHLGVRFRLGGEQKEISLLELGCRIGLYSERQSRKSATLSGLRKEVTVKANHLLLGFWPTIGDDGFNVGNTKVAAIRDPRVKLAHYCIATTIAGRKESTHRVTEIDLFYFYCIYSDEVVCNIPYWLAKIARSYGLLNNEMMGALNVEPSPHVFIKKSLISMGVVIELHNGGCFGPQHERPWRKMMKVMRQLEETRVMKGLEDGRAHWMFDHIVRQLQYLPTRDNLDHHLQIHPFPGYKADYPPIGYQEYMPPGYEYRPGPSQDDS